MSAALTLWNKHMMKLFVHKEEAIGTLFQPVLWVVLFGTGMKGIMGAAMPGGEDTYTGNALLFCVIVGYTSDSLGD